MLSDDVPGFLSAEGARRKSREKLKELLQMSSGVVTVIPAFLKQFSVPPSLPSLILPNGISYEKMSGRVYAREREIQSVPHPRIGYIGAIRDGFHFEALHWLAERHPEWAFVFAGSIHSEVGDRWSPLSRLPNIHHMGVVPYDQLASFIKELDVGLIPYDPEHRRLYQVDSLKLKEFLACGVPAVTFTSLALFQDVKGLTWEAATAEMMELAITEASASRDCLELVARRKQAVQTQYEWDTLATSLRAFIDQVMGRSWTQLAEHREREG
jgi:glycosyltransferase involved in cell wall biosynthesis